MRHLLGCTLLLAALAAGCTDEPDSDAGRGSAPAPRSTAAPPSASNDPEARDPETGATQPLVFAVNARRPALELTEHQAARLRRGAIATWGRLDQPGGRLRTTEDTTTLTHLPMDTVAVVAVEAVTPAVRVATVAGVDPLHDPAAYPIQVPGSVPAAVTTLTVVGDVMLGRGVGGDPLRPMARRLASADITVGNLESTLAVLGSPNPVQGDPFSASRTVRRDLRAAGFDALSLANNHTGDYGAASLVETVRLLREGGLRPFGAGRDLAAARRPAVLERDGVRFGFVGFNAIGETPEAGAGRPGANAVSMPPRTGPLDRAELGRVLGDVRRLARRVDVVVVMPHWGTQYTHRPEPVQHDVARALARAGADLVVGGHPHWVQGAETISGSLVVHSLGNFVFDMDFSPQTMEGLVLEATFWDGRLMAADFVPYRMTDDFAPHLLTDADAASVLNPFWRFSSLAATS